MTGLGFTGFGQNGESTWNGAANVKVRQIEFAPNFKVLLDSWNMKTNIWLRECVYKRVTPKGKKPGNTSSMITFLTSAFWVSIFPVLVVALLKIECSMALPLVITSRLSLAGSLHPLHGLPAPTSALCFFPGQTSNPLLPKGCMILPGLFLPS